jgi:hypothetical protein
MGLDIRTPIGLMFSVFGVILTVYGFLSGRVIYGRSLGININLVWGLTLLAFGASMLLLGMRRGRFLKKSSDGVKEKGQEVLKRR